MWGLAVQAWSSDRCSLQVPIHLKHDSRTRTAQPNGSPNLIGTQR